MLQGWCMAKVLIKPKYCVRKKIFFVSNTLKIFFHQESQHCQVTIPSLDALWNYELRSSNIMPPCIDKMSGFTKMSRQSPDPI